MHRDFSLRRMRFAKVEFPTEQDAANALCGLMLRGRVTCLRGGVMLVPEPALEWLASETIPHRVLGMLHWDQFVVLYKTQLGLPCE